MMGRLVDGVWQERAADGPSADGRFVRRETQFRNVIQKGDPLHPPVAGRYRLYAAYACPWAHRVMIYRALLDLEDAIPVTIVHPDMLEGGWAFRDEPEPLYGFERLHEIYTKADPHYSGRVSVPVLFDTERETIVNNESAEILRMLDEAFVRGPNATDLDLRPLAHRDEIDALNLRIYEDVNNGVYKCGFATTQTAYEEAANALFATLDALEQRLENRRFLITDHLTETDVRLFVTLLRYELVYYGHFKCSRRRIRDYPNLWLHTRRLYQTPAIRRTVRMDHIRRHYYYSHESINPQRIVPLEPAIDWDEPVD